MTLPAPSPLILIVDDDPNIRELLSVNLSAAGYAVHTIGDGLQALQFLKEARPSVIILDVMMPEVDGWEVCKTVRDDPELEKTIIIMLTARDTERDRLVGTSILGADAYITKPFEIDDLMTTIQGLLHGRA